MSTGTKAPGVVVLGMHRSGTSAATRLLSLLGLHLPRQEDLVPPSAKNPKGYWESMSLVAFNERLLRSVGSDMRAPAQLEVEWEADPRLEPLRAAGADAFRRTFPSEPWVWKDPRNCLVLSFWRPLFGAAPVVVMVNRNPIEIVASTQRASRGDGKVYVLALWERYLHQALAQIQGLPVLASSYEGLLAEPLDWCVRAQDFLADAGIPTAPPDADDVRAFVDESLRHVTATRDEALSDSDLSHAQRELFLTLERLQGPHERFLPPELPRETPTTGPLLAERRRVLQLEWEVARAQQHMQRRLWTRARRFVRTRARPAS